MLRAPDFDKTPLNEDLAYRIGHAFERGIADGYPARSLVRAGVVQYHPLRGGIFYRRQPVKYVIVHSTEPAIPLNAVRIIESWSSMGRRHPGAQYVVDRDGSIYQCVDPDLATVHVNIFKTLPGINNDNSIGIEMCHTGRQDYPQKQRDSVIRLVAYLQDRYQVADDNVITHRYAQQGDHTDPVHFDWDAFQRDKNHFRRKAIALRVNKIRDDARDWKAGEATPANTTASASVSGQKSDGDVKPSRAIAPSIREFAAPTSIKPQRVEAIQPPQPQTTRPGSVQLRGPIEVEPGLDTQLNEGPGEDEEQLSMPKSNPAPGARPKPVEAPPAASPAVKQTPQAVIDSTPKAPLLVPQKEPAPLAPVRAPAAVPQKPPAVAPASSSSNATIQPAPSTPVKTREAGEEKPDTMFQKMRRFFKESFSEDY